MEVPNARRIARAIADGIVAGEPRPGDVRHSLADIGKAREVLGYAPRVDFEEGLRRTFAAYEEDARREALERVG